MKTTILMSCVVQAGISNDVPNIFAQNASGTDQSFHS